jgi:hypothetical protein
MEKEKKEKEPLSPPFRPPSISNNKYPCDILRNAVADNKVRSRYLTRKPIDQSPVYDRPFDDEFRTESSNKHGIARGRNLETVSLCFGWQTIKRTRLMGEVAF